MLMDSRELAEVLDFTRYIANRERSANGNIIAIIHRVTIWQARKHNKINSIFPLEDVHNHIVVEHLFYTVDRIMLAT